MNAEAEYRCLIMFARFPEQGQVKSRLAKDLGAEAATNLYRCFVEDLLERFSKKDYRLLIAFYPAEKEREMREMLGDEFSYSPQTDGDLGERMKLSFLRCFSEGTRSVVLIGSDIPDLPARIVDEAFRALDKYGAAIGLPSSRAANQSTAPFPAAEKRRDATWHGSGPVAREAGSRAHG